MNPKKDTLVILTPGFAADETDSTCLPMQQALVRNINTCFPQLKVTIIAFQYPYAEKEYCWFGNRIISFNGKNRGGVIKLLLRRKIYQALWQLQQEHHIVGLLSFWYGECAYVAQQFAKKQNLVHRCWILGQDAREKNHYPRQLKLPSTVLVALSHFLQDEFERNHHIRPQHLVTTGIDLPALQPGSLRHIDLLAAGSLIPLKQFDIFIDLVAAIKKIFPSIKAILIGDGPERKTLEIKIRTAGLQENITLTGTLPHDEVLQHMAQAKILLHPSSYEGYSGVCAEALSQGMHVISFCRAMKTAIPQWHIAETVTNMQQLATALLNDPATKYNSQVCCTMIDVVKKMMLLFRYPATGMGS
ncbi:MAG: glycosyltransferase [Bacteroidetes bacterium]|nr:glycosyltransferase [Bacteroidota bacterium]